MNTDKARYFALLLYPESIPESWEMELELIDIPVAISPLYDKDKSNVEGQEYKKVRYHATYVAANPVVTHSIRKRIQRVLGNKSIAKVQVVEQSAENVYLYLAHESKGAIARNKYRYAKKDIRLLSNFDIDKYVVFDIEDKEEILDDVCDMIDDHGLTNIRESRRLVKERGSDYSSPSMKIMNSVLHSHTGLIRLHFGAVYQGRKYGQSYADTHTGEIKRWFWVFEYTKLCTCKWL